ncbi:MAG TPA: glycogen-binding domain-containing protein [Longimicrobiales bacterium]
MHTYLHMGVRLTLLIALAATAAPARAQQWNLSAQAGRMRSMLDPAEAAATIALGLYYDSPETGFRLSAGVPTSSVDALWAGAGLWKRAAFRHGGFMAGADIAASAFMTRDRSRSVQNTPTPPLIPGPFDPPLDPVADLSGHALAGQALPVIGYEHARVQIHARAGLSHYIAQFGDVETDRTVRLADVQLTLLPAPDLALMPVMRRYEAGDEEATTYAGVTAALAHERGSVWGSAGYWMDLDGADVPWAAGTTLRVHPRAAIEASARRDTFDPLYMQPPQTSWHIGFSLRVGGPAGPPAPPIPHAYVDGRATIRLPVSESAEPPSIAGDFNGWEPAPMQRSGDHWTFTVTLAPGVYNYAFVRADGTWFVPEDTPGRREDGMGGHVAVLVVE